MEPIEFIEPIESDKYNKVSPEKQWAIELSEEEFQREFERRNPRADAIPRKDLWLGMPMPNNRLIDPINPESYEMEIPGLRKPNIVQTDDVEMKIFRCRGQGCDRTFSAQIGQISHERKCQYIEKEKDG